MPTLTQVLPTAAMPGDTITLTGRFLGSVTSVTVGGTAAAFTIASSRRITATVPAVSTSTGEVVATDDTGSASLPFTVLRWGPWIQPPDTCEPYTRLDGGEQGRSDGSSDTDVWVEGDGAIQGGAQWAIDYGAAEGSTETFVYGASVYAVDPQWLIDNYPDAVMPQVTPDPPADAYGFPEFEADYGSPLGPVDISVGLSAQSAQLWTNPVPDADYGIGEPPALPTDLSTFRAYLLTGDLYTWDVVSDDHRNVRFTDWTLPDTVTGLPLETEVAASTGTMTPGSGSEPDTLWIGGAADGVTVTHTIDLTDMDSQGGWAIGVFPSLWIDHYLAAPAPDPPPAAPEPWLVQFNAALQTTDLPTMCIHYRPPRVRWMLPVPIGTVPPPQRQFPRDDGLGISTRRSWPPVTSKQYGQRRGPSATYQ